MDAHLRARAAWNTVRASYTGSKTTDLVCSLDLNQIAPNTQGYDALRNTRPFPDWNVVTTRDNGAQVDLSRPRLRVQAPFLAECFESSYTLAHHETDPGGAVPGVYRRKRRHHGRLFRGDGDLGPRVHPPASLGQYLPLGTALRSRLVAYVSRSRRRSAGRRLGCDGQDPRCSRARF